MLTGKLLSYQECKDKEATVDFAKFPEGLYMLTLEQDGRKKVLKI